MARYRPVYGGDKKGAWSGFKTVAQDADRAGAGAMEAGRDGSSVSFASAVGDKVPKIPAPLPKLRVLPTGGVGAAEAVSGGPDEDLLLVSPKGTIDGAFQIEVEGFRGVYWIGGSLNPETDRLAEHAQGTKGGGRRQPRSGPHAPPTPRGAPSSSSAA